MDILTCVKRVPNTGERIVLTDDQRGVDDLGLGFTVSPHEECAVEEAIQQIEEHGGTATVLTLGPDDATEQLITAIARGADEPVLLEADDTDPGPSAVATEIAAFVEDHGDGEVGFDLLLFGNESADAANYQVGVRVAQALDIPVVTGVKDLEVDGDVATAKREVSGGWEVFEVDLPAVVTVKEGINHPRYASMRGRMQAQRTPVEAVAVEPDEDDRFELVRLEVPEAEAAEAEILGEGPTAAAAVVDVLEELEVI
ncbi:MAG: electron transfer flavoprotein subunit beta/FixA family protein [Halobacteriales archaeon]